MDRFAVLFMVICAFIAHSLAASTRQTDCQRRREQELRATRNLTGLLVPVCDEHGEYLPMQCFGQAVRGRPFCACYDSDFGQIKGPSRNLLTCNCIRKHHDWEHNRGADRGNEPHCNTTSGEYNPVQCSNTHHWCVNTTSGEHLGEEVSGGCSSDLSNVTCPRAGSHHGHDSPHGDSAHRGTASHRGGSSDHDDSSHQSGSSSQHGGTSPQGGSEHHGLHS